MLRKFFLSKYRQGRSLAKFRANKMSYKEKKSIVNWLFSGKNDTGKHYGIYLKRIDKKKWDVEISTQLDYMNAL